ncbi:MAG: cytochrome c oxidase subunit II [Pseudomonadota bacterium]
MLHAKSQVARLLAGVAALAALFVAPAAFAAWDLNMPKGVTELSDDIWNLHMLIFWVCVAIAVVVFGAMFYSIFKFQKAKGAVPGNFNHSTTLEIVWTAVPVIILVAMAIPSARMLVKMEDTRDPDLTVKVTGYQWKWAYEYLDDEFQYFSNIDSLSNQIRQLDSGMDPSEHEHYLRDVDEPMVVPVGAKVRVLITASDVIHAWWVPEIARKKDAIPGFINEFWFRVEQPGVYRGQCAELCGRDHGFMPVVVDARSPEDYLEWVNERRVLAGLPPRPTSDATVAAASE